MSALNDELARRGLLRRGAVMRLLQIDESALRFLVSQRQLTEVTFPWKGHSGCGYPKTEVEGAEAVYRSGVIRIVRPQ